jgi:hypothetical protein
MDILKRLPRHLGTKIKFHFKHPNAYLIENFWKKPHILNKKWLISQLNRYNWLVYSKDFHCYGESRIVRTWFDELEGPGHLASKLHIHDILDPHGNAHTNIRTFIPRSRERNKAMKFLWHAGRLAVFNLDDRAGEREWLKRSLFGGVYPITKRPKVHYPCNPWTKKWNLRWKKDSILQKLVKKEWDRNPWRICQWGGALAVGSIIHKLNGEIEIYMGRINIDNMPACSVGIDPYI